MRKNKTPVHHKIMGSAQAAPDVRIGGGQRRHAPKIRSKLTNLGGLGACPQKIFFFLIMQNAVNWTIFSFLSGPPLGAAYVTCSLKAPVL